MPSLVSRGSDETKRPPFLIPIGLHPSCFSHYKSINTFQESTMSHSLLLRDLIYVSICLLKSWILINPDGLYHGVNVSLIHSCLCTRISFLLPFQWNSLSSEKCNAPRNFLLFQRNVALVTDGSVSSFCRLQEKWFKVWIMNRKRNKEEFLIDTVILLSLIMDVQPL
jgi:hypothetical protein